MRALVTGATGFVGPHLLARLKQPVVLSPRCRSGSASFGEVQFRIVPLGPDDRAATAGSV